MPPRATLLLYTDGLVERRREPLDTGIARAADLVQENRDTALDDLASQVMSRLAPDGGYQDDVALLLYRQPAPLEMEFPADASQLAPTRAALRGWLARAGVDPDQTLKVLIAAGEALANAIEHGHRHRHRGHHQPARDRVGRPAAGDRHRRRLVEDRPWRPRHRGRGIALMRALMQDVTIEPRRHRHHGSHAREDRLMATPLSLNTDRRDDGTLVLTATGRDRPEQYRRLRRALRDARRRRATARRSPSTSAGCEYLDSGAINVLFANADRIHLIANPVLMPVLNISGLTEVATVEPASCRARQS